jgi:hypothetical protein
MWLRGSGLYKQQSLINFKSLSSGTGRAKNFLMQFCFFGFANFFYDHCICEIADGIGQVPTGNHRDSKYRSDKKSDLTTIINEKRKDLLYRSGLPLAKVVQDLFTRITYL